MFFVDYDMVPLLIQQNYPKAFPEKTHPADLSAASACIAIGDTVNNRSLSFLPTNYTGIANDPLGSGMGLAF